MTFLSVSPGGSTLQATITARFGRGPLPRGDYVFDDGVERPGRQPLGRVIPHELPALDRPGRRQLLSSALDQQPDSRRFHFNTSLPTNPGV